jgi:hypothetical protein
MFLSNGRNTQSRNLNDYVGIVQFIVYSDGNYKREKLNFKGTYNRVTLAFRYCCHIRFLLSWRRENEEREDSVSLAKG